MVNLELDSLWSVLCCGLLFQGYIIFSMSVRFPLGSEAGNEHIDPHWIFDLATTKHLSKIYLSTLRAQLSHFQKSEKPISWFVKGVNNIFNQ